MDAVPLTAVAVPFLGGLECAWFCVRSHPKREHIAAAQLRQDEAIEVFLPRIRYKRCTRYGPVWTTEALFTSYLFARFDPELCLRRVQHAHAVRGIVRFGLRYPTIPSEVMEQLRAASGPEEMCVAGETFEPGDRVRIAGGPFHDLQALVTRALPGRQRVALLLDFLGRQTPVELDSACLVPV